MPPPVFFFPPPKLTATLRDARLLTLSRVEWRYSMTVALAARATGAAAASRRAARKAARMVGMKRGARGRVDGAKVLTPE